ncbi:hypothetical protein DRP04_02205 [Archaeoglobales archaeon]|nr:MAG: hypothetical protein DRP04_02205 [Archaeoglobales archaeon]HDN73804.1 hypothetical protein [Archaeoglobus sp.]
MGFSVVAAFSILMLSLLFVLSIAGGLLCQDIKELNSLIKLQKKKDIETISTDFEISSISTSIISLSTYNLSVDVCNTGSKTLDSSKFTFLIDGVYVTPYSYNKTRIYPLECAEFKFGNLNGTLGSVHRIKAISENGISRFEEYSVT